MKSPRTARGPLPARRLAVLAASALGLAALTGCPQAPHPLGFPVPEDQEKLPRPPAEQVQPLDPALNQAARQTLSTLSADPVQQAIVRVHAVEGEREALGAEASADILRAMKDPAPVVRYAGAMAAGDLKLAEAGEPLRLMVGDTNPYVWVAVRYALHRLGDYALSHGFERSAVDADPHVRGMTAMVLGRLGEPSAKKILMVLRKDESPLVRQQASEALYRLGDEAGREDLAGLVESSYPDDEMVGILGLASTHNSEARQIIRNRLSSDYEQVKLVAAWGIGMIGGPPYDLGYPAAVAGAKSGDPKIRILAARALGAIGRTDAQPLLREMLKDNDPEVRVAAATAVLQLTPPGKRPLPGGVPG